MTEIAYKFVAQARKTNGKQLAKIARNEGKIPAIVYGSNEPNVAISLSKIDIDKLYLGGNYKSRVVAINDGTKEFRAIAREIQTHPVSDKPIHVDFQRVSSGHDIIISIPVNVINLDKAPGIKRGGTLNIVRRTIEFICDPDHVPTAINIDLTGLEIGHSIHIEGIALPKGARPTIKRNFTVVTIIGRKAKDDAESLLATAQPETQVKSDEQVAAEKAEKKPADKAGDKKAAEKPEKAEKKPAEKKK